MPMRDSDLDRPEQDLDAEVLKRALHAVNNLVVITDPTDEVNPVVWVNDFFCSFTGYPRDEVIGRSWTFLLDEDRDQPGLATLDSAVREGRYTRVLLRNYRKDGTLFFNDLHVSPVPTDTGGTEYFVWLMKRNEARANEGPPTFGRPAVVRLGVLALSALALGWFLFRGAPSFLDASILSRSKGAGTTDPLGETPYFAAIFVIVNIHHYFMDNVIWRRDFTARVEGGRLVGSGSKIGAAPVDRTIAWDASTERGRMVTSNGAGVQGVKGVTNWLLLPEPDYMAVRPKLR